MAACYESFYRRFTEIFDADNCRIFDCRYHLHCRHFLSLLYLTTLLIIFRHYSLQKLYSSSTFVKKRITEIPSTRNLPLLVIGIINFTVGLGNTADGKVDPIAAAVLGFVVASFYAALLVRPSQAINLFTGSIVDGIKDVAGVIFLFMGIGMLVTATTQKAATDILNPLFAAVMPNSFYGVLLLFTVLAPAALYRGPFNMYGMGTGIAAILTSLNFLPATALYGMFSGVGYLQAIADPTNSHNTWLAGFAGVDTTNVMKRILPYAWGACVLMMIFVAVLK